MKLTEDEIDAKVEEWHRGDYPGPLHEFLGWTWEQYARWVEVGEVPDENGSDDGP